MRGRREFFAHWENKLGLLLVFVFLVGAVFAPLISPQDEKNPGAFKQVGRQTDLYPHPPSRDAILGTLPSQYDVFHTLVWGMRSAMGFGLLVAVGSFMLGVFFGSVAGYAGGFVNSLMMRIADAFLTFPIVAGVVFLQQLIGMSINAMGGTFYFNIGTLGKILYFAEEPTAFMTLLTKVDPVMIILILFSWVPYARLVNSIVLTLKQTDYVQAARALGGSSLWVVRRHLIPNSIGPALVLGARDVGSAVILQATFTFIGLGGSSPWGILLSMGRKFVLGTGGSLLTHWWVYLPVTLAVILFGVAWNLVGDGLNDVLTPGSHSELFMKAGETEKEPAQTSSAKKPALVAPTSPQVSQAILRVRRVSETDTDLVLLEARKCVSVDDLPHALNAYQYLIQHSRSIKDVLPDLAQLVKKHPRDPRVWQTLGDALDCAGDSDHAAKSYEQARKLMQQ